MIAVPSGVHLPRYRLSVALLLMAALAACGGASRLDEDQQAMVRLLSLLAVLATLWPLDFAPLRRHAATVAAAAAIVALPLLQLTPLPPALWAALPGHVLYADIAAATGTIGWRPLTLTPDLTRNTLLALLPGFAAGLSSLYLDQQQRVHLYETIVGLAVISAVWGLAQANSGGTAYHLYHASNADTAPGLFANRNHQAALLACALPLAGVLGGLRSHGRNRTPALLATAGIMLLLMLGLAATASRMGLVLGAVGMVGAVAGFRASGAPIWRWSARGLAIGLSGIALVSVVALAIDRSGVLGRIGGAGLASDTRMAALPALLRMARQFWPTGAGFGAFASIYPQFEPTTALSTIFLNQAHDDALQLVIEGGLPALLLLLAFLAWWLWRATGLIIGQLRGTPAPLGVAAMVVTAILMLSSLVDYPLRTPWLSAIFAIACIEMHRTAVARSLARRRSAETMPVAAPA